MRCSAEAAGPWGQLITKPMPWTHFMYYKHKPKSFQSFPLSKTWHNVACTILQASFNAHGKTLDVLPHSFLIVFKNVNASLSLYRDPGGDYFSLFPPATTLVQVTVTSPRGCCGYLPPCLIALTPTQQPVIFLKHKSSHVTQLLKILQQHPLTFRGKSLRPRK